jgi:hypothetical protein
VTYPEIPFVCCHCGQHRQRYGMNRASGKPICKSCYVRDLSSPEAVRKRRLIVAAVRKVEPGLSDAAINGCIERSVRTVHGLSVLARQVNTSPEVLVGSPDATKLAFSFIEQLIAAGAQNAALPRCPACDRRVPTTAGGGDRVCATCLSRRNEPPCSKCGRFKKIRLRTKDGAICTTCHGRDPATWEDCTICGRHRRVNARAEDGGAICNSCYRPTPDECGECGEVREIVSRKEGRALCTRCYRKFAALRPCGRCGRLKRIKKRATEHNPDLCAACWWEPIAICGRCGQEGMCRGVQKGVPECLRCRLNDRITDVLTGPNGQISDDLLRVKEAVLAVDNPRSGHIWMRSPAVQVLRDIAQERLPLTHEALDGLRQTASVVHLRDLLVSLGLLPYRDPFIAKIESAITKRAAALSSENSKTLRAYGKWSVMRRARRKADLHRLTYNGTKNAIAEVHEAARFLAWLETEDRPLSSVAQVDVDAWLSNGVKARYNVRAFLLWAQARKLCPTLHVPFFGGQETPKGPVDHEARWELARRLLHDDTIDPADRVVGALVVIYAQRVSNIAKLTTADVMQRDGEILLRLGKEQVLIPEPLGTLLRDLPWRRQVGISGKLHATDWLFPGRQAGRHQHPEYLRVRLAKLGIDCRAQRRAALLQLGSEVPPAVLADMLNLAPSTAMKWVEWAGGNWSNYLASRRRVGVQ